MKRFPFKLFNIKWKSLLFVPWFTFFWILVTSFKNSLLNCRNRSSRTLASNARDWLLMTLLELLWVVGQIITNLFMYLKVYLFFAGVLSCLISLNSSLFKFTQEISHIPRNLLLNFLPVKNPKPKQKSDIIGCGWK